jgi:hypothetical protein
MLKLVIICLLVAVSAFNVKPKMFNRVTKLRGFEEDLVLLKNGKKVGSLEFTYKLFNRIGMIGILRAINELNRSNSPFEQNTIDEEKLMTGLIL